MVNLEKFVLICTIGTPHGLKGELHVRSYANVPLALGHYGILYALDGRKFKIVTLFQKKNKIIVLFDGIRNRVDAEKLNKLDLYIKRNSMDNNLLEEDEFFSVDLEGLQAFDSTGIYWGMVTHVYDFGAGTILELLDQTKKQCVLIPFSKAAIPNIDIKKNRLQVEPIAAGLIDSLERTFLA
ncbi:16S rRNA processing protein RimM [Liberibacter crescens BT-1]|uniref:Ribosome maturation factor RimM n=1 Tax=Liberibacter crescens (strain BT-1) TaxID=1215343 RepID=L0EWC5_LIBCB|nr:ribosome maturation factor RimM [Liberibacter crescens]AGA65262.1 16S rRNA processing protein RimM [Liberibacter crescens BT-1]AMC13198.1 hypothetical protein RL73_06415 [Liberibacter crescens]